MCVLEVSIGSTDKTECKLKSLGENGNNIFVRLCYKYSCREIISIMSLVVNRIQQELHI